MAWRPDIEIYNNAPFLMADFNSRQIVNLLAYWFHEQGHKLMQFCER
jgi:hypothetical protein